MFNRLILLGRLTRDVEIRHTQGGTTLGKFGVAVNTYRGKDRKDEVLFLDCTAFDKTAELLEKHFKKGDPVMLEGRLVLQQWDDKNGGGKRSKHEMNVNTFAFVPRAADSDEQEDGRDPPPAKKTGAAPAGGQPDYGDIPF